MKIVVLKKGTHENHPRKGDEKFMIDPVCSSVTLLKGKKNILIDTGYRGFEEEILKALEKNGLKPEDIDIIINTHFHLDHSYNNYLFKNAKIIAGHGVWYNKKAKLYYNAEKIRIPGLEEIKIIKTPGHTKACISVVVKTDRTYVITGDAIIEEFIRRKWLKGVWLKSVKKIFDIADVIIPGHNEVMEGAGFEELKRLVNETLD